MPERFMVTVPMPRQPSPIDTRPSMYVAVDALPTIAEFLSGLIGAIEENPALAMSALSLNGNDLLGKKEYANISSIYVITYEDESSAASMYRKLGIYITNDYGHHVTYDQTTTAIIEEGIRAYEPDYVESWRLKTYLGRLAAWKQDFEPTSE